ncbi:MAG: hypothetical protein WDW36_007398 [Sanguina aurantia]
MCGLVILVCLQDRLELLRPEAAALLAAVPAAAAVTAPSDASASTPFVNGLFEYLKLWTGLGTLYSIDMMIKYAFSLAAIKFPSSLGGMFLLVAVLTVIGSEKAQHISNFFTPTLEWIAKWLPLFYIASLVTLPAGLKGVSGEELGKIFLILCFGMVGTLLFTAQTAVVIRSMVKTENKEVAKAKRATPFLASHFQAWASLLLASLGITLVSNAMVTSSLVSSSLGPQMALPFLLSITVLGYMAGCAVPARFQGLLHPVLITAAAGNLGSAFYGQLMGLDYAQAQSAYYSKGVGLMGAGDVLMAFLGSVIISFGFRIYAQRDTMARHAPEILGASFLSSLFSFFTTAFAAKALGLSVALSKALITRSVTVALAIPIGMQFEAPLSIVAAAVLLQGLLGANFGPQLMTAVGINDTIARGLAAASTAGGLGTASLTSREPEALPFCALAYSMVGIMSTVLAAIPAVRNLLISIVS